MNGSTVETAADHQPRPVEITITVPDLARLRPGRALRYRLFLAGWFGVFLGLAVTGLVTDNRALGNAGFLVMLAGCGWLVVRDLRVRAVDNREYERLASQAAAAIAARTGAEVPIPALLHLLGAGVERTGNPWNPTRPRQPQPRVRWGNGPVAYETALQPLRLQSGQPVTFTVQRLGPEDR